MFRAIRGYRAAPSGEKKRLRGLCSPALRLESLEDRVLLDNGLNASLSFGDLRIHDATVGDTIRVRQINNQISVDGISILTTSGMAAMVSAGQVSRIDINIQGGNDHVDMDSGAVQGQQPLAFPISVTVGTRNDTIAFRGLSTFVDAQGQVLGLDASDSALYDLESTNQLYRTDVASGQNTLLAEAVGSYALAADGSVYGQFTDGWMWRYFKGMGAMVDSGVVNYLVMPDSSAYYYKANGGLWLQHSDGSYLPQLDPQTSSMELSANADIVALRRDGLLGSYVKGGFKSLDTGVQFYRTSADGAIYYEKQDGSLWTITPTGTRNQLNNTRYSMFADDTVYQLQNGALQNLGSDGIWRQVTNNIIQAVTGPDTQGVVSTFWLTNTGQVARANASGFSWFSGGISQLLVGPDDHGVVSTLAVLANGGQVEAWNKPFYNHYVTPAGINVHNLRLLWTDPASPSDLTKAGVAGDTDHGTVYWSATSNGAHEYGINADGQLYQDTGGAPVLVDTAKVKSYLIALDGSIYEVNSGGTLWHWTSTQSKALDNVPVQAIRLAYNSTLPVPDNAPSQGSPPLQSLYYLTQGGRVGQVSNDAGTYLSAAGENTSYAMTPDGTVYCAEITGKAWHLFILGSDGNWQQTSDQFQTPTATATSRTLLTTDNPPRIFTFSTTGSSAPLTPQDSGGYGFGLLKLILGDALQQTPLQNGGIRIELGSFLRADMTFNQKSFTFDNVQLNLAAFTDAVIGSILSELKTLTSPLLPIAHTLEDPLPVLSDINALLPGGGDVNLAHILGLPAIDQFAKTILEINQLSPPSLVADSWIDVGSFQATWNPNGLDLPLSILPGSLAPPDLYGELSTKAGALASFIQDGLVKNLGMAFPALNDPSTLFQVLAGDNVSLFTYTVDLNVPTPSSTWTFVFFDDVPIALPLPVTASASASISQFSIGAHAEFGFDTSGIKKGNLADGFYVHGLMLTASVTFKVTGRVDLGIAEANGANGTLSGSLTVTTGATLKGAGAGTLVYADQLVSGAAYVSVKPISLTGEVKCTVSFSAPAVIVDAIQSHGEETLDHARQLLQDAQDAYNQAENALQHPGDFLQHPWERSATLSMI